VSRARAPEARERERQWRAAEVPHEFHERAAAVAVPDKWRRWGYEFEFRQGYAAGLYADGIVCPVWHRGLAGSDRRQAWQAGRDAGRKERKRTEVPHRAEARERVPIGECKDAPWWPRWRKLRMDWLRNTAIPANEAIRDEAVARIAELTRELETLEGER
jgi:hypothetical protein